MVVDWPFADHLGASLVLDALVLVRAYDQVRLGSEFHCDRGAQNAGVDYAKYCTEVGVKRSMGGKTGAC